MRARSVLILGVLSALTAGCSVDVLHYGAKNLVYAPCNRANGAKECAKAKALAEDSWRRFQGCNPGVRYSKDFAAGYVFGFSDYVEKGGPGNPPVVAPLHYRKVRFETPEGHQQIADWFAGCRAGIAAAMASGYRDYVILPMSVPPPKPEVPPYSPQTAVPGLESEPVLPAPKPIGPERVPRPIPAPPAESLPLTGPMSGPSSALVPLAPPPPALVSPPAPVSAAAPGTLPPADARGPGSESLGVRAEPAPAPRASVWPAATPALRTTPASPLKPTVQPPWEDPPSPAVEAQRLAAALQSATAVETPLGGRTPVDTGVWMPARGSVRRDVPGSHGSPTDPRSIAVGQPANPSPAPESGLRSEAAPPPNSTDGPVPIVSHRGARWQN